jgi:UDP-N-acetylmuramyl tripeptide synthase
VRPRIPLAAEVIAARAAGGLSRLVRTGGGTTVPGKLLWKLDPTAIDRLAARLPLGSVLISATNGKTTTTAMVASILRGRMRLAHNRAGANLVSGVASALISARDCELGVFEVDEAALPEVARRLAPRAVCLGNLFRDQLDRYGELELVAERWRGAVDALDPGACVVVNGDDPQVGDLARDRPHSIVFGLDDPSCARPELQHAADSRHCIRCGSPYDFVDAYVGHLGNYRCPSCGHRRPPLDVVGRHIQLRGTTGVAFSLETPKGSTRVGLKVAGLYNVYNAVAAAALTQAIGADLDEINTGLERFVPAFGRFERIRIGDKSALMLLIKNPAGANEVVRTLLDGGTPRLLLVALNDGIADGQDVSWIWDVDFEPLLEGGVERIVASGDRAAELALRFRYGGFPVGSIEIVPDPATGLDRALELTPADGELVVLPTYTAMLALRRIVAERGFVRPYWERAA